MKFLHILFESGKSLVSNNPVEVAATAAFATAISAISANAVFMQSGHHFSPIWETREESAFHASVRGIQPSFLSTSGGDVTNTVAGRPYLFQGTSLKHVPVPKASPAKNNNAAGKASLVRDIQSHLAEAGFYDGKVDGIFGDETRTSIMGFQSASGYLPDGQPSFGLLADIKTAIAISRSKQDTKVRQISTGSLPLPPDALAADTVRKVQSGLKEQYGEDAIVVDGVFGNQTRLVLRKFQQRFGLPVSGELDVPTLNKLRSVGILDPDA